MIRRSVQIALILITVFNLNTTHAAVKDEGNLSELIETGDTIIKFRTPLTVFGIKVSEIKINRSFVHSYPGGETITIQDFTLGSLSPDGHWEKSGVDFRDGSIISDLVGNWSLTKDGSIRMKLNWKNETGLDIEIKPDGRVVDLNQKTPMDKGSFNANVVIPRIEPDLGGRSLQIVNGASFLFFKKELQIGNETITGIRIIQPGFINDVNGTSEAEAGNFVNGKWVPIKSKPILEVSTYTGGLVIDVKDGHRKAFVGFIDSEKEKLMVPPGFPKSIVSNLKPYELEIRGIDVRPVRGILSWVKAKIKFKKINKDSDSKGSSCYQFYK